MFGRGGLAGGGGVGRGVEGAEEVGDAVGTALAQGEHGEQRYQQREDGHELPSGQLEAEAAPRKPGDRLGIFVLVVFVAWGHRQGNAPPAGRKCWTRSSTRRSPRQDEIPGENATSSVAPAPGS